MDTVFGPGFAIDAAGTVIADDAFSVRALERGWRVQVAIPDLSYVPSGSTADIEALAAARRNAARPEVMPERLFPNAKVMAVGGAWCRALLVVDMEFDERAVFRSSSLLRAAGRASIEFASYAEADDEAAPLFPKLADARRFVSLAMPWLGLDVPPFIPAELLVSVLMRLTNIACCVKMVEEGNGEALWRSAASGRFLFESRLSIRPEPHLPMNLPAYARFTSPLRRFEDLVNQRILLACHDERPAPYRTEELEAIADGLCPPLDDNAPPPWQRVEMEAGEDHVAARCLLDGPGDLSLPALSWLLERFEAVELLLPKLAVSVMLGKGPLFQAAQTALLARFASCTLDARRAVLLLGLHGGHLNCPNSVEDEAGIMTGEMTLERDGRTVSSGVVSVRTFGAWVMEASVAMAAAFCGLPTPERHPHPGENAMQRLLDVCVARGWAAPRIELYHSLAPSHHLTSVRLGTLFSGVHGSRKAGYAEAAACDSILRQLGIADEDVRPAPSLAHLCRAGQVPVPSRDIHWDRGLAHCRLFLPPSRATGGLMVHGDGSGRTPQNAERIALANFTARLADAMNAREAMEEQKALLHLTEGDQELCPCA